MKKILSTSLVLGLSMVSLLGIFTPKVSADTTLQSCQLTTGKVISCDQVSFRDSRKVFYQEVKIVNNIIVSRGDYVFCKNGYYPLAKQCMYIEAAVL